MKSKNKNTLNILITGCAGFIGYHLCYHLLKNKRIYIYGLDNLNNYYDVQLKKNRLKNLKKFNNFLFNKIDISKLNDLKKIFDKNKIEFVIHLAAQAGVRYSISNPDIYFQSNMLGFFNMIELSRLNKIKHFIYASSSSVYGSSNKYPLDENLSTSKPINFYGATKKSNEIISYSYASVYNLPVTGLRFFTVYGPFGRPDMSLFKFTEKILNNKKIDIYNNGNHIRDFTYIDDVVVAISKLITKPSKKKIPYNIFNIGSNNPKKLSHFIKLIEKTLDKKSKKNYLALQKGDIFKTHAKITKINKKIMFKPKIQIEDGIKNFIKWFKNYYNY